MREDTRNRCALLPHLSFLAFMRLSFVVTQSQEEWIRNRIEQDIDELHGRYTRNT